MSSLHPGEYDTEVSKQITLLVEVHDKAKYIQIMEFLHKYNIQVDFERSYEWGGTHIIARK